MDTHFCTFTLIHSSYTYCTRTGRRVHFLMGSLFSFPPHSFCSWQRWRATSGRPPASSASWTRSGRTRRSEAARWPTTRPTPLRSRPRRSPPAAAASGGAAGRTRRPPPHARSSRPGRVQEAPAVRSLQTTHRAMVRLVRIYTVLVRVQCVL